VPTNQQSVTPRLEFHRKQAKALHKAVSSKDSTSIDRVRAQLSRFNPQEPFLLSHAQWVVAREQGHTSWPQFKRHLESLPDTTTLDDSNESTPTPDRKDKPMTTTQTALKGAAISDEAVLAKTGKNWKEWFDIFDDAGGVNMTHKEIVAIAHEHGAGSWWQQMVTVEYERARGKRDMYMSCDGEYRVNASKTINIPIGQLFQAWHDPKIRERWLPGVSLTIRKANENKNLRITWVDGQSVDVNLLSKADVKSQCAVEHGKLAGQNEVEEKRAYWAAALQRLKGLLEK